MHVADPLGRGAALPEALDAVLLCVPDAEISAAAAARPRRPGMLAGHCSATTTLAPTACA